jgi:glycosyltransferase involved in cell wall biosynthesis
VVSSRPLFSIVSAIHNVEAYLPDFIDSIERQRIDPSLIEIVAVDDGSTDGSLAMLNDWAARSPGRVKVFTKPQGGQASARNLGLEHATGEWVTFTDPDDMLRPNFFRVARRFANAHRNVEVMSSKPLLFHERTGQISDSHPRRRQYVTGTRIVNLDHDPNTFTGSATVSLFRLDRIQAAGLRYDPRVWPNFEDGHFAIHYLMDLDKPIVGILAGAEYIYRKRAALDSASQLSTTDPGRYTNVFEYGYLDVLESARKRYGSVPEWLQQVIIYELSWYLSDDEKITSTVRMSADIVPRFHELLARVLRYIDPGVVHRHNVRRLKPSWVQILAHAGRGTDWHSPIAARTSVDPDMRLQRICYRYVGTRPSEEFVLDGAPIEPAYGKTMSHKYYRRSLLEERVAWVPAHPGLRLRLNGRDTRIVEGWPRATVPPVPRSVIPRVLLYATLRQSYVADAIRRRIRAFGLKIWTLFVMAPVRLIAQTSPFRSTFRDAWVLMDRLYNADDNGERLFEYLVAERPDINAWFVVKPGTPDWKRLRAAGVTRLVAHGSFRWKMLMLNCSWLLSSHADLAVARPREIMHITGRRTWRFAFLQHGVIKDDLSVWLNPREIDLFVVSTEPELGSVVGDGSAYIYTRKETRNTGLPRFDRLLAKGRAVSPRDRNLVIIAPTWRTWLTLPINPATQWRDVADSFWSSEYFESWDRIVRSPAIAEAAARANVRIAFMPHPNLQPILSKLDLPAHVEPLTFAGNDVQELYARCAVLVTDYSSVAFNVAYLNGSIVYYQFDYDAMMSGAHMGREGYFDYVRDGFGPVALDDATAVAAIVAAIDNRGVPTPEYQERIDRTFANRDGHACQRVVDAVEELSRPYPLPSVWVGAPPIAGPEGVVSSGPTG